LILLAGLIAGIGLGFLILGLVFSGRLFGARLPSLEGGVVDSPQVGQPAPDFELQTLSGQQVQLNSLRGKPVLVNFWATWCAPCIVEMPAIEKYYRKYPGQFYVLAVNADEPAGEVESFLKDKGLTFDILLDPGGKIQSLYRLRGYPTTYVIDSDGVVRKLQIGPLSESQLQEYLSQVGVGG
jgi:peroxiredoxin